MSEPPIWSRCSTCGQFSLSNPPPAQREHSTKAELVEALRNFGTSLSVCADGGAFTDTSSFLPVLVDIIRLASRLPDPPPAECRVAHEPTEAMIQAGLDVDTEIVVADYLGSITRDAVRAVYRAVERARVAGVPDKGEKS